jgi:hypothetical protein
MRNKITLQGFKELQEFSIPRRIMVWVFFNISGGYDNAPRV